MMLAAVFSVLTGSAAGVGLPAVTPTEVGMDAARLSTIERVVERGINAGGYPGASVVVGRRGGTVLQRGFGRLSWSSTSPLVIADQTIYDIASLTKVVGTTAAIMVLYDQGKISLDSPVGRYIPEFTGDRKELVTVRMLLTHRSGLPAGRDIWRITHDPVEARKVVLSSSLVYTPGTQYVYSDLGADVLGMLVEQISGQRLDVFLHNHVFEPLGMHETFFKPADSLKYRVAPTEIAPPRGYPVRGEVHDENAYAMGGITGHAGLFSTAADLAVFAQMLVNGGELHGVRVIADSTVTLFTQRTAGHRALGWDTPTGEYGSGNYLSERSYGHTGYTGTSMWIDPERKMFVILLTNRVHAAKAARPTRVISDVRSDLSDAASLAVMDMPNGPLAMPVSFRADRATGWNEPVRRARISKSKARAQARAKAQAKSRAKATKKTKAKKKTPVAKALSSSDGSTSRTAAS